MKYELGLGALPLGDGRTRFCVWAPHVKQVEAHIFGPWERVVPLERGALVGHGGAVPSQLTSQGEVNFDLSPQAVVLFASSQEQ